MGKQPVSPRIRKARIGALIPVVPIGDEVRGTLNTLGFALCALTLAICVVLHVGSFLRIVHPKWLIPPFFLVFGAVLCSRAVEPRLRLPLRTDKVSLVGLGLLVYAILLFVYFYKTTGGASSVTVVEGQYVSMYKDHVIRAITEEEYRMFPNLWTRSMSAFMGMGAVFLLKIFHIPPMAQEWSPRMTTPSAGGAI